MFLTHESPQPYFCVTSSLNNTAYCHAAKIMNLLYLYFVTTDEIVESLARETCNKSKVFKFHKYIQILYGI